MRFSGFGQHSRLHNLAVSAVGNRTIEMRYLPTDTGVTHAIRAMQGAGQGGGVGEVGEMGGGLGVQSKRGWRRSGRGRRALVALFRWLSLGVPLLGDGSIVLSSFSSLDVRTYVCSSSFPWRAGWACLFNPSFRGPQVLVSSIVPCRAIWVGLLFHSLEGHMCWPLPFFPEFPHFH